MITNPLHDLPTIDDIEDANHAVKAGTRTADGVTVAVGASRQRRKARR